jgi:hypothetical protein
LFVALQLVAVSTAGGHHVRRQSCPALIDSTVSTHDGPVTVRRKSVPRLVLPTSSDDDRKKKYRMSLSHGYLDGVGLSEDSEHASSPHRVYEQTKVGDGHSQLFVRSRRNTAYSRSLDDLTAVTVDDNPAERWSSHSSLASDELLSQESRERELQARDAELQDDLDYLPITTTSVDEESLATEGGTAESLAAPFAPSDDQVAETPVPYSTEQTHKDAMGPIEVRPLLRSLALS